MNNTNKIQWAKKVPQILIRQLYEKDALGIIDEELIDEVGWALYARCESILTVTEAYLRRVKCPCCGNLISRGNDRSEMKLIECQKCGWKITWRDYHKTFQRKQLFAANAADIFKDYIQRFQKSKKPQEKMLAIDKLIHEFHRGLKEYGRPVAVNLIEGKMKDVISFLDKLTYGNDNAAGLDDSHIIWREKLTSTSWAKSFLKIDK